MDMEIVIIDHFNLIKQIPQQKQVQYDLHRQLQELRVIANKFGLYDASDFLRLSCNI